MSSLAPRAVIVRRTSEYEALLRDHGTRGQAAFFLEGRGQALGPVEARHETLQAALRTARAAVPDAWSFAEVERGDLDRFLFTPNDIVVAVGQDGLVANLAKYVTDQPVIGVTPSLEGSEGVLTTLAPAALGRTLLQVEAGRAAIAGRTMVEARSSAGERLIALNELFVGHRSHQSARYVLDFAGTQEFQSSSGIIVTTGTGATGWARSIMTATGRHHDLPAAAPVAAFFAREPWPSRTTACTLASGRIEAGATLAVTSRIDGGGLIFADGIEQDFLRFDWGERVEIGIARRRLNHVVAGGS